MKTLTYIVKVKVNSEVTKESFVNFLKEAIGIWGGQLHPDDPLFGSKKVTVISIPKK